MLLVKSFLYHKCRQNFRTFITIRQGYSIIANIIDTAVKDLYNTGKSENYFFSTCNKQHNTPNLQTSSSGSRRSNEVPKHLYPVHLLDHVPNKFLLWFIRTWGYKDSSVCDEDCTAACVYVRALAMSVFMKY